ncbi:hypothetical protein [Bacillus wiedmannii]|uniref:hypothetical protein n=1 Tax=Bacillus wiedmannii TaxID=1890302 RepID=UPI000BF0E026|nr:hypothetical protein [Bacillus wiedmannii]PEL17591.1 hypothetical protein CN599_16220 [Bacillus wiedmannii]PGZ95780.1 hypothetical protein COE63_27425 [Bacillus wiedmannii]
MEEKEIITLKHAAHKLTVSHPHKIDPDKIQTLDDVIQILKRINLQVNDEGLKGIEHLIADDND